MSPAAQRAIAGPGHSLPEGERDNRGLPCCKPLLHLVEKFTFTSCFFGEKLCFDDSHCAAPSAAESMNSVMPIHIPYDAPIDDR